MPKKPKQLKKSPQANSTSHKTAKEKSPRNPRIFTEQVLQYLNKDWKVIVYSFIIGVMIMGILFFAYDSLTLFDELEMKKQERVIVLEEIAAWERVMNVFPDYRDGYFKLALLYYQLGNRQKAKENLEDTLHIDPLHTEGNILKEKLGEI